MKPLSNTLLLEQVMPSSSPVVELQAQAYDWPTEPSYISSSKYDWVKKDIGEPWITACCASDGSLLAVSDVVYHEPLYGGYLHGLVSFVEGTFRTIKSFNVKRYTSPSSDTDFTGGAVVLTDTSVTHVPEFGEQKAPNYVHPSGIKLVADPSSQEVTLIIYNFGSAGQVDDYVNYIYTYTSDDCGATWGEKTFIGSNPRYIQYGSRANIHYPLLQVSAAYKANGDLLIAIPYSGRPVKSSDFTTSVTAWLYIRRSGTWSERTLYYIPVRTPRHPSMAYAQLAPVGGSEEPVEIRVVHDGHDWCFIIALKDKGSWDVRYAFVVLGDGGNIPYDSIYPVVQQWSGVIGVDNTIQVGDAEETIDSINDTSPLGSGGQNIHLFNPYMSRNVSTILPPTSDRRGLTFDPDYHFVIYDNSQGSTFTPYSDPNVGWDMLKIVGKPVTFALCQNDKLTMYHQSKQFPFPAGIFDKADTIETNQLVCLTHSDDYIFAYGIENVFISHIPEYWSAPTAGIGAGATYDFPMGKILSIKETVRPIETGEPSTLSVILDNSDGTYDSLTGDLAVLKRGSRINIDLGYIVTGISCTHPYAKYFVADIGYGREPNRATCTIRCTNAVGLLNRYVFCREIYWNEYEESNEFDTRVSAYNIISQLISAIGGTLSYASRSDFVTSFYPRIHVQAGNTAGTILIRLMRLIPDHIRFDGNDATLYLPEEDDNPIYHYQGPS